MAGKIGDIPIVDGFASEVMGEAWKMQVRDEQRAEGMAGIIGDIPIVDGFASEVMGGRRERGWLAMSRERKGWLGKSAIYRLSMGLPLR
ncbi:hypothetical protein ACET65_11760 [Aeromonas rivipollensis]